MDITRNWRLKTSRSQLLATRCPVTGEVMLPGQQKPAAAQAVYTYEHDDNSQVTDTTARYAQAAR